MAALAGGSSANPARQGPQGQAATSAIASSSSTMPPIYELHPPAWRPRLHPGSHSLGYPDVYPPKPGQVEDQLSESAVKTGIAGRSAVSNETYSAHDMIYDWLQGTRVTHRIGSLFHEVAQRRKQLAKIHGGPAASHFRPPQRVTLNEAKLAGYIKELADPNVPLRKIARSVPHGYRGERMLDMLWNGGGTAPVVAAARAQHQATTSPAAPTTPSASAGTPNPDKAGNGTHRSIAIDRAVWFVRVVGASELASSRARNISSATYTAEWTTLFFNWLRRQIVELNIIHPHAASGGPTSPLPPTTPLGAATPRTPAANDFASAYSLPREGPYSLFLEEDFRVRWLAKWEYSTSLLAAVAREGLLDLQVASRLSLEMLRHANRAQLHFVLALVRELMACISSSITLAHLAIEVVCDKLRDLRDVTNAGAALSRARGELQDITTHLWRQAPDAFVSIQQWPRVEPLLKQANSVDLGSDTFKEIQARNRTLRGAVQAPSGRSGKRREQQDERLADIAALDGVCVTHDIASAADRIFYPGLSQDEVKSKVATVMTWATTWWRIGRHRPFAASSLLSIAIPRLSRGKGRERFDFDAIFFTYLCDVDTAMRAGEVEGEEAAPDEYLSVNVDSLVILLGDLCRREVFSFQKYLQRLIARGLTAASSRDELSRKHTDGTANPTNGHTGDHSLGESLHSKLLRSIPVVPGSSASESQRRSAIYGNRIKESWEDAMSRRASRELSTALPWLTDASEENIGATDGQQETMQESESDLDKLGRFWACSRFVRFRIVRTLISPRVKDPAWRRSRLSPLRLITLAELLSRAQEFSTLHFLLAQVTNDQTISSQLRDLARQLSIGHRIIWAAILLPCDVWPAPEERQRSSIPPAPHRTQAMLPSRDAVKASMASYGVVGDRHSDLSEGELVALSNTLAGSTLVLQSCVELLESSPHSNIEDLCDWIDTFLAKDTSFLVFFAKAAMVFLQQCSSNHAPRVLPLFKAFIDHGLVSCRDIVSDYLVQQARHCASSEDSQGGSFDQTAMEIGTYVLTATSTTLAARSRLQASLAELFTKESYAAPLLLAGKLQVIGHNTSLDEHTRERALSLLTPICNREDFRVAFQGSFKESAAMLLKSIDSGAASSLLARLLQHSDESGDSRSDEDDAEALDEHRRVWHRNAYFVHLATKLRLILKERSLGAADSGSKLLRLARHVNEHLLGGASDLLTAFVDDLQMLTSGRSDELVCAILDDRLKRLCQSLAQQAPSLPEVESSLSALVTIADASASPTAHTLSAGAHAFELVLNFFEAPRGWRLKGAARSQHGLTNGLQTKAVVDSSNRLRAAYAHAGTLCLLLRNGNILDSAATKTRVPALFAAMSRWCLDHASFEGICDEDVLPVLDTAQNLLCMAGHEGQAAAQALARDKLLSLIQERDVHRSAIITSRLLALSGTPLPLDRALLDMPLTGKSLITEGQGYAKAFNDGLYTTTSLRPWDWHPNPDAAETVNSTLSSRSSTELGCLPNSGPVSLGHFAAHKTLDRLFLGNATMRGGPFDGICDGGSIEAQEENMTPAAGANFGLHLGGESVFARDVLQGHILPTESLAHIGSNPEVDTKEDKDTEQEQIITLVPSLCNARIKLREIEARREAEHEAEVRRQAAITKKQEADARKKKRQDSTAGKDVEEIAASEANGKKRKGRTPSTAGEPIKAVGKAAKGRVGSTAAKDAPNAKRAKKGQD